MGLTEKTVELWEKQTGVFGLEIGRYWGWRREERSGGSLD